MLGALRQATEGYLPDGCPFVIGGGLVRDGFGGARPGDIDIWLPSNISVDACEEFLEVITDSFEGSSGAIVFRGPQANGGEWTEGTQNLADYSDVNNHWVIEVEIPDYPKVNFMRSMLQWTNDSQAFFNGLMRFFDIDICMMFLAYERGQSDTRYVIVPQHMVQWFAQSYRGETVPPRLNSIYWNRARMDMTSHDRTQARMDKMNAKYNFGMTMDTVRMIEQDSIVAYPVLIRNFAGWTNYIFPSVTPAYQTEIPQYEATGALFPTQRLFS